jgi:ABC-2 type transport system ATP-binding protein
LLSAFRRPTSGTLTIGGEDNFENAKIMSNISFHYEKNYTEETSTVKKMLKYVGKYRKNYDEEYAYKLAEMFELQIEKPVYKLSKGKQSAFEVIMGLASRCPITIFDESYLSMDAPTRVKFYNEVLEEQSREPRIFILSTHLVSEMDYLFDEVLILHEGKLLVHDEYETLVSKGMTVTGLAEKVDEFTKGMKVLNQQRLGNTKAVTIYRENSRDLAAKAKSAGLEVGPISLQDLFIYITERE